MKRFLRVKPTPGNDAGGVINGQVEMPDLSANPFIRSSVGLLLLSEIGMTGTTAVGIFYSDKIIMKSGTLHGQSWPIPSEFPVVSLPAFSWHV